MAKRRFTKYPQSNVMTSNDKIDACDDIMAATTSNRYTIKSVSDEGTYYLVKDWRKNRELWVSKDKMDRHPEWWFTSSGKAKQSLKSLLSVMDEYISDTFTVVDMSGNETPLDVQGLGFTPIYDTNACDDIMSSTGSSSSSDFTVIQNIYSDGEEYMTEDNVMPVYSQEYGVDMDEVLATYPRIFDRAMKGWTDETFEAGDILTEGSYAAFGFIKRLIGDGQMYSDYKDYVAQHPELPNPSRQIEIRINNPSCLPSAEEQRRRNSEELGRRLGKMLGLGRY